MRKSDDELILGEVMKDGSTAWISQSGRYYVRRERLVDNVRVPSSDDWTHIAYYTRGGLRVPLARAQCGNCLEIIESKHCGDFTSCGCGESSVDTDRWMPESGRWIGKARKVDE